MWFSGMSLGLIQDIEATRFFVQERPLPSVGSCHVREGKYKSCGVQKKKKKEKKERKKNKEIGDCRKRKVTPNESTECRCIGAVSRVGSKTIGYSHIFQPVVDLSGIKITVNIACQKPPGYIVAAVA